MTTTLGIDVARFGNDRTAIAIQTNNHLHTLITIRQTDLVTQAESIKTITASYPDLKTINVDDTGVGGGLTDILRADLGGKVHAVNYAARPPAKYAEHYPDTASALWFHFQRLLRDELVSISPDLPHLDSLTRELTSREWEFTSDRGRIRVGKKGEVKAVLGRSPDLADAVLLAFWEGLVLSPEFYDVGV